MNIIYINNLDQFLVFVFPYFPYYYNSNYHIIIHIIFIYLITNQNNLFILHIFIQLNFMYHKSYHLPFHGWHFLTLMMNIYRYTIIDFQGCTMQNHDLTCLKRDIKWVSNSLKHAAFIYWTQKWEMIISYSSMMI